ncbi:hypothetical protein JYU23_00550, partial [bacterium AH-315-C07]|nr:hypothetical protein [bacterium AH-315-C07]
WDGNISNCDAGSLSQSTLDKILDRLNYFRDLAGCPTSVTFDTSSNAKAQAAALIMAANQTLDHYPDSTFTCYSADGYEGAQSCNLSYFSSAIISDAITNQIHDDGAGNYPAGHRRWILYSRAEKLGYGANVNYAALWITPSVYNDAPTSWPTYIAYPVPGYMPAPLVFERWLLSVPDGDFSNASVTMIDKDGKSVSLTIETLASNYGDNSIVWVPSGITTNSSSDINYQVTVSNVVVNGNTKSYTYNVIIVQV